MKSRHLAFFVLVLLAIAAVAQYFYYMPLMSENMTTKFGSAMGRSSQTSFTLQYFLVMGGISALFLGILWWIPKMPDRFINLPHKEYWLAPERRAATLESLGTQMLWMHNATLAFLIAVFFFIFRANLHGTPKLGPGFWIFFAFYMIFTHAWGISLIVKYSSKPKR